MFALLLSDKLDPFYQNISSFPTVLYTVLLALCVLYWAGAVIGMIDIDLLNVDFDDDINADSPHTGPDVLAGLLLRFSWVGVPVIITLSIMALVGWLLSYYAVHFLLGGISSTLLRYALGLPVFVVTLIAAAWVAGQLIKPLRTLFANTARQHTKHLLGQTAIVRTARVDHGFGEATLDDGGAGLILKIRATGEDQFNRGDRVVIFEKLEQQNIYRVISEEEFSGL